MGQHDVYRVLVNQGRTGTEIPRFDGELNQDGVVDVDDMMIVLDNFGTPGSWSARW